jgi:hypothetical protein
MADGDDHDRRDRELFWLRFAVFVAVLALLATVYGIYDQHQIAVDARARADEFKAALTASQTENSRLRAEKAALASVSLQNILDQYNFRAAALKSAAYAYEKAKAAKVMKIPGLGAGAALTLAEHDLYAAADDFITFKNRWREVAELFNKMLDGNATLMENSRRENNADAVHDAALRIISTSPEVAEPLRIKLDSLKSSP